MSLHYGWPTYWTAEVPRFSEGQGEPPVPDGDPNLRSANEVLNYGVKTIDGDLGQVADLIMEEANWFIRFLAVRTGSWAGGQQFLIGTRWVGSVSWATREIFLPHSKDVL